MLTTKIFLNLSRTNQTYFLLIVIWELPVYGEQCSYGCEIFIRTLYGFTLRLYGYHHHSIFQLSKKERKEQNNQKSKISP